LAAGALFLPALDKLERARRDEAVARGDGRILQRPDAALIAARHQPDRKRAIASRIRVDELPGQPVVDRDIIERAEAILQGLELVREAAQPLLCLAAGEQRGKESDGVAQLLDRDAQLVAVARVELGDLAGLLPHLAGSPRDLLAREIGGATV